jgi:hypothetical protein
MFSKKRESKSFLKIFLNDWKELFIDVGEEFKKLWRKLKRK